MTAFLKKYSVMIIAALVACAVVIAAGFSAVGKRAEAENRQSSYKLTRFDFVLQSPSAEQVATLKNTDGIKSVFPCYGFGMSLRGAKSAEMDYVFMSDNLDGWEISLFSPETCIEGGADADGIMLDERAAENLGVGVGDSVTYTLAGYSYSKKVSGIYLSSTYRDMDKKGVALTAVTADALSKFPVSVAYTHAFVAASDAQKCEAALAGYKPYGRIQTLEDYVKEYKAVNRKPTNLTEEEWTERITNAYEEYKINFENGEYPQAVQRKADYMADVADRVESTLNAANSLAVAAGAGCAALVSVLGVVAVFVNRKNDGLRRSYGEEKSKMLRGYILTHSACAAVAAFVSLAVLALRGLVLRQFAVCLPVALTCSLPLLVSVIPVAVAAYIYVGKLYSAAKRAENAAPQTTAENEETCGGEEGV